MKLIALLTTVLLTHVFTIIFLTTFPLTQVFANDYLFENNVSLIELDKRIIQGILEPEASKADELLRIAFEYHDALESIARVLELDYKPDRNIKMIRELKAAGGPQFAKMKVDVNKLNEIYKWDREDKIRFKSVFESVKRMWFSLVHHLSKVDAYPSTIATTPETDY